MMNIELIRNKGYSWYKNAGLYVKGFVFDEKGNCFQNEDLLSYFKGISNEKDLYQILLKTNGFFSVVIDAQNCVLAAVDRVRSLPLLYSHKIGVITDDVDTIGYTSNEFSRSEEDEFLHCGYVTGSDTLINHIKQIQAGEVFIYNKQFKTSLCNRYFNFKHSNFYNLTDQQLVEKYDDVLDDVFRSYIRLLNGRTVVVPLSAGHDSRIIVQKLHSLGYKNVVCFSYGKQNNWESKISKKVAKFYGYKWLFVEYLSSDLYNLYNKEIDKYMKYAININSSAHTQDFLAVLKLKNRLPKDAVFMPGHTGDFISGGHIPSSFNDVNPKSQIINQIFLKHFSLMGSLDFIKNKIYDKISSQIKQKDESDLEKASSIYEQWVWRERQVKYIVNSVRVYDFYNFQWMMPLWDNRIIKFWSKVPAEKRRERRLYFKYANQKYNSNILVNPPTSFFKKIMNKIMDPWYSRFIKKQNIFSLLVTRVKHIFPFFEKEYLDSNKRLVNFPRTGLNIIKMFEVLSKE